jgi:hypothetical protein
MLVFCPGGILFYYLLYKSGIVPHALSLWGLITVIPMLIGTVSQIFGYTLPFFLYAPYVPFEFAIGVWILVKGIKEGQEGMHSPMLQRSASTRQRLPSHQA